MKKVFIKRRMIQYACRDFGTPKRSELSSSVTARVSCLVIDPPPAPNLREVYKGLTWKFPWHDIPPVCLLSRVLYLGTTFFAPVRGLLEIHLFTRPLWSRHPSSPGRLDIHLIISCGCHIQLLYDFLSNKFTDIPTLIILTVGSISNMWFATHGYDRVCWADHSFNT
jgi:hypothetical protein